MLNGSRFPRHPKGHRADVLSLPGPPSAKKSVWTGKREGRHGASYPSAQGRLGVGVWDWLGFSSTVVVLWWISSPWDPARVLCWKKAPRLREAWSLTSTFFIPFYLTHYYSTVLYEVMKVAHILEHLIKCIFYNHFNIYLSMSPYYISILRYPLMVFRGMAVWETLQQPDSCYPFNDITCLMKLRSSDRVTQRIKMFWGRLVPNVTSSTGGNLLSWAVRSFRSIGHTGNGEVRPP